MVLYCITVVQLRSVQSSGVQFSKAGYLSPCVEHALDLVLASYHSQEISAMIGDMLRPIGFAAARHQERKKDILRQETAKSMVA